MSFARIVWLAVVLVSILSFTFGTVAHAKSRVTVSHKDAVRIYELMVPFLQAQFVARDCPELKIDKRSAAYRRHEDAINVNLRALGVSSQKGAFTVVQSVAANRLPDDYARLVSGYGIEPANPQSWCLAGRKMIAQQDSIGVFLRER